MSDRADIRKWTKTGERSRVSGGYNQVSPPLTLREERDRGGGLLRLGARLPTAADASSASLFHRINAIGHDARARL